MINLSNPKTDVIILLKQFKKWLKRDYCGKYFDTVSVADWLSEKYEKFPLGDEAILLAAAWRESGLIEYDKANLEKIDKDNPFTIWRIKDDKLSQSPKGS